ncbi:hypothetical protein ACTFIZ_005512 [Dictyostelium cf. discoideum]
MKIKKNDFLLLIILLNISNFVLGGTIKLSLKSQGYYYSNSWINIGERKYVLDGRGINAIAFDPSDPNVLKMLKSDTHMSNPPGDDNVSKGFISFIGEVQSRKNWVIAIVSLDDSYLNMSEDLRQWFKRYGISLSFRGSYALVLQSDGLALNKIEGRFSIIEGSSTILESVIVSY